MKRIPFLLCVISCVLLIGGMSAVSAQPGGGRPGGGRPSGPPPGGFKPRNGQISKGQPNNQQRQPKKNLSGVYKVSGTLKDSAARTPLSYVNVALLNKKDSSFAKATSTDDNGDFTLANLANGEYIFRATFVGYKPYYRQVTIKGEHVQLGNIQMQTSATRLKGVVVKGERPIYSVDGEKTVYNVAEDPSIQTGTTADALQNAPGVEVDIEGNVTLRGISSVEIWINDKPSKLTAENLKTYLEVLPANALDRIETITNPSAKYATSAEAVINIITTAHIKKNHFISFGANASSQPNVGPWMSYVWANDKLSFNIYDGLRYSYRENASEGYSIHRRDSKFNAGMFDTTSIEEYTSSSDNRTLSNFFFGNVSYTIDSISDVSMYLSLHNSWNESSSDNKERRNETYSGGYDYTYQTINDNNSSSLRGNFYTSYSRKFDNKGHNLRVTADGNFSNNSSDNYFIRDYTVYNDMDQQKYTASHSESQGLGLSVRYNRPYSKDGDFSYGLNADWNKQKNHYNPLHFDYTAKDYTIGDTLREYTSTDNGSDVGADMEWSRRFGSFTLQLGLGLDYEQTALSYVNMVFPDDTTYRFLTWNPSVHLSYRTQSMHTFKASYTLRTNTPSAYNMTTFRNYGEDSYSIGNRNLIPSYTHNAEAGWTKYFSRFGSIGVDAYGRFSMNEVSRITDVTEDEDPYIGRIVSFSMPYNMGTTYRYGGSLHATYSPSGFFNLRFYGNLYHAVYDMNYEKLGKNVHTEATTYSLRLFGWAKLFNRFQIHASARYSSPTRTLFSESKANYSLNCGLSSNFFKRKMSVYINVQDIFNWGRKVGSSNASTNPYYLSYGTDKVLNSRYISAGLTFRFGKMELERNVSQDGGMSE